MSPSLFFFKLTEKFLLQPHAGARHRELKECQKITDGTRLWLDTLQTAERQNDCAVLGSSHSS